MVRRDCMDIEGAKKRPAEMPASEFFGGAERDRTIQFLTAGRPLKAIKYWHHCIHVSLPCPGMPPNSPVFVILFCNSWLYTKRSRYLYRFLSNKPTIDSNCTQNRDNNLGFRKGPPFDPVGVAEVLRDFPVVPEAEAVSQQDVLL